MTNTLYYGDNLDILRQHVGDESVDLVYLDPPFNSNANYNVLFKERSGEESPAQIKAFTDTWEWTQESERTFEQEIVLNPETPPNVKDMITAFRQFIGSNAMMAYLVMMTPRLVELHRVLKPTGSIYLHCDPTASHYLKLLMDGIFDPGYFRSEINWRRTNAHNDAKQGRRQYGNVRDTIFFYTKGAKWTWNWLYTEYDNQYIDSFYKFTEQDSGRRYRMDDLTAAKPGGDTSYEWRVKRPRGGDWEADLTNEHTQPVAGGNTKACCRTGVGTGRTPRTEWLQCPRKGAWSMPKQVRRTISAIWTKCPASRCRTIGVTYARPPSRSPWATPPRKPQALLERIIQASSNEGDVVLDPFCGCGTAVAAAEKLKRRWTGIDVTHLAVALMKNRLKTAFDIVPGRDYEVVGEPADVGSARALAEQDRYQFQYWAMSLLEAFPREQGKRGADRGIDGVVYFIDGPRRSPQKAIVQVKSGKVSSPLIRDLKGTVEREKAALGLFITLEEPTRDMRTEAVSAGFYHSDVWQRDFPKVQIRTVAELLDGRAFELPQHPSMYQPAQRVEREEGRQAGLEEAG